MKGHAGMFSSGDDLFLLSHKMMFTNEIINETTRNYFSKVENPNQSERALGWDTNFNGNGSCLGLSRSTYLHLGYTGTQICNDPIRKIFTILLYDSFFLLIFRSNRVYPNPNNNKIREIRRLFNSNVQIALDN
jgi:serine-type D-Ala-D-Ala carboxypeptidase